MAVMLTAAAVFVYVQLRADLDESVDTALEARVAALAAGGRPTVEEAEDGFAHLVTRRGEVRARAGGAAGRVLRADELRAAARGQLWIERRVDGVEGTTRVLARATTSGAPRIAVVGQSLDDRDETLAGVVTSFAVGGVAALVLASLAGYALAAAALRPVEAMRRRARRVSLSGDDERLPLPVARDEVRRLGETLNEMLDRLRRSFERERSFVADASHELRTPLATVKTELETALRAPDCGPQTRESLVAAVGECDRLTQLAEDLLVLARAGEGALVVRPERVPARAVLEGVRDRFVARGREHGRGIRVEAGEGKLVCDPLLMRQALANLVDNALRHGKGEVLLRAFPHAGGVVLEVADDGPGVPVEVRERAFERFTRGDSARTGSGAGLGLAIVRAIAEAHGGRADLVPDRPAAVHLWLPEP